ncbi:Serine protease Hayan [Eumeta japonica]|uniref:trypsin n=1 Tax=Eumeta variegata TaxID=151549 RepID=A0A4C1W869_EUMVA|nr:Serine protease Hayan [Eumeta japonica]
MRIANRECQKIINSTIPPLDLHILGGEEAAPGEFPHMVALGFDKGQGLSFDCGGSLVSNTYVLTAAHCIVTVDGIEPTVVRTGVVELGPKNFNESTDIRIAEVIVHPNYTRREKYHDLALVRLEKPIDPSYNLKPACLYTHNDEPRIALTVTGWGTTSNTRDIRSDFLLKANVTVVSRSQCSEDYTNWRKLPVGISPEQICAGDKDGIRDTCQGDSGGPLQGLTENDGNYRLIGITSFGRGCGSAVPGVYTRLSYYLDWIESVVWRN